MICVGITGLIGTGKTLAADSLLNKGFVKVKMADPLKTMLRSVGLTEDEIEGSMKEKPSPLLCNVTPRYAMQTLGTEWGRQCIGEDVWVNMWAAQAREFLNMSIGVVADDVRFANEARIIREMGGCVVRLVRDGVERTGHLSEEMDFEVDYTILNDGSSEELVWRLSNIVTGRITNLTS